MKSTRLLAALAVGLIASMSAASLSVMRPAPRAPKLSLKTSEPSRTVGSSRNGGRRGTNMAHKRAALKARNVKRHRKACRG